LLVRDFFTFHHLGIAVASIEKALPFYEKLFGYCLVSGPFADPIQRVSVCFLGRGQPGEITLELIEPLGEESPIRKTLAKGGGAYHVCYEVGDLDRALQLATESGCVVVSRPAPAVAFENRRIAWFYTPVRELVEVLERID
jgi:methylmalonyl-CoA/ethylmalonyl-CoA epimerase